MSVTPIRIFKVLFGFGVAALFAWFCVFWNRTFIEVQSTLTAAAQGVSAEVAAASKSEAASCNDPVVPLPLRPEDTFIGPPTDANEPTQDLASKAVGRMFQARIHGPYALSVRDGLNEMVIGTSLMARGVLEAQGGDRQDGLDSMLGAIPAQLPTYGYISSGYGVRHSPFTGRMVYHKGIDFAVAYGSPVYATADGVITYAGWYHGLGKMVMINHGFGIVTRYGHNSAVTLHAGDVVKRGDIIARAGSTGRSTGSHVHYEVWVNGKTIDPSQFMFDVPERRTDEEMQDLAMTSTYKKRSHHLGLAVGGDGTPMDRETTSTPYDQNALLPLNIAVIGLFTFVATLMILTLWPRRAVLGRDYV